MKVAKLIVTLIVFSLMSFEGFGGAYEMGYKTGYTIGKWGAFILVPLVLLALAYFYFRKKQRS